MYCSFAIYWHFLGFLLRGNTSTIEIVILTVLVAVFIGKFLMARVDAVKEIKKLEETQNFYIQHATELRTELDSKSGTIDWIHLKSDLDRACFYAYQSERKIRDLKWLYRIK